MQGFTQVPIRLVALLVLVPVLCSAQPASDTGGRSALSQPPFAGTLFAVSRSITPSDPTSFLSLSYEGQAPRRMSDRRTPGRPRLEPYLFRATYAGGSTIEIQVNPAFGSLEVARAQAETYAPILGQLPAVLLKHLKTVQINAGNHLLGGSNNNVLIHTDSGALHTARGTVQEVILHEAVHAVLDAEHASSPAWQAAQAADGQFISIHARNAPGIEDIAESFVAYFAFRYRPDRISTSVANTISRTIPNRIAYFDSQQFDMYPYELPDTTVRHATLEKASPGSTAYPAHVRGEAAANPDGTSEGSDAGLLRLLLLAVVVGTGVAAYQVRGRYPRNLLASPLARRLARRQPAVGKDFPNNAVSHGDT